MGGEEVCFVEEAFESNYIAPVGPQVDAFEREFAEIVGIRHAVALSSGTGAMHLALAFRVTCSCLIHRGSEHTRRVGQEDVDRAFLGVLASVDCLIFAKP